MKYRYAALFAAVAVAAPLRQGAEDIAPRSEEGLAGKIGVAAVVAGNGDATSVKNTKRGGVTDDIGVGPVALGNGDGTGVKNAKRDVIGLGDDILGHDQYYDDGDLLSVLRRAQDGGVTDDIGIGAVVGGDGDGTGVKNAKRFEIGDVDVGSTGVGRTDNGIPILDPNL